MFYLRPFLVHADILPSSKPILGGASAGLFLDREIMEFVYEHRK